MTQRQTPTPSPRHRALILSAQELAQQWAESLSPVERSWRARLWARWRGRLGRPWEPQLARSRGGLWARGWPKKSIQSRSRSTATNFEDVETALSQEWDRSKGKSKLKWDQAKPAARDAWERNDAHSKIEEASRLQD
ncbi:MAG: hypothetical protein ABSH08_10220 [Tepidisphaeraceae bacterium]